MYAGSKTIIVCSVHFIRFKKYAFSAKIWFVKTSTRIAKYESWVVKSNPAYVYVMYGNSISSCFFSVFVFETPLKDWLPFYSLILLTLWFRYSQTLIQESCMYLSSQCFLNSLHKTLKFQEKSKRKRAFSSNLQT